MYVWYELDRAAAWVESVTELNSQQGDHMLNIPTLVATNKIRWTHEEHDASEFFYKLVHFRDHIEIAVLP